MGGVDGLDARFKALVKRLGGTPAELDADYGPRFRYYERLFSHHYGSLGEKERNEAAHRLASGRPAKADTIRVFEAYRHGATDDLGPPPPPHPEATARAHARVEKFEQWRRRQAEDDSR